MVRQSNLWGICMTAAAGALWGAAAPAADDTELDALEASAPPAATAKDAAANIVRRPLELPARASAEHRANNLFAARSWYTPPPPAPPPIEAPPPAPTAPPLPFTFVGSFEQGGATVYFLVHGDRTYDVKVGDVVDNTYSVDGVRDGQMLLTYLPLKTSQTLALQKN